MARPYASLVSGTFKTAADRDAAIAQLDAFLRDVLAKQPGVLACYHVQTGELAITNVTVYGSEEAARAGGAAVGPKVAAILGGKLAAPPATSGGPVVGSIPRSGPVGPFFAIAPGTFPGGFDRAPPGGVCFSAFLFVRNARGEVLLGKYDPRDPGWTARVGLDQARIERYSTGWTVPASHLKLGESPREAAQRVACEMLGLDLREVTVRSVEVEAYELDRLPGERHVDYIALADARHDGDVARPPWYVELAWHDLRALPASAYARGHEDVVARFVSSKTGRA
jgi:ADP-ribose pyrophosphatase YjhB (NUDIX family)